MSIFDQYNSALGNRSEIRNEEVSKLPQLPPNSGYVSVRLKTQNPIFSKQKMNLQLPANINFLCVSNDWIVILMGNQMVFRLNMKQPDKQSEVLIEKQLSGYKVTGMFLDQLGNHLFLSLSPKSSGYTHELLYLNRHSVKPKFISKFKDHEITAIGFNQENTSEQSTGVILLGTSKGLIFEADISVDGEKLLQNNWKQLPSYIPMYGSKEVDGLVKSINYALGLSMKLFMDDLCIFDIGRGVDSPITGISYFRAPGTCNFIVLVTTLDRMYKFHETLRSFDDKVTSLQNIFNSYLNVPEEAKDFESVSSSLNYSKLEFIMEKTYPKSFGWLTESGVMFGDLNQIADSPAFITSKQTISYPEQQDDFHTASYMSKTNHNAPISFVMTNFHLLLLYSDHVTVVSLINHQIVHDEYFQDQFGKLMNIIKDPSNGNVYCYSNKSIFRYKINNEKRNVWQMYLDKNEFDLAKKYSEDNPVHRDIVLSRIAEDLFARKQYLKSAETYAKTKRSFEEVTLKFLQIKENIPLICYLKSRLRELNPAIDQTQVTLLVVWLVELYLTQMNASRDNPFLQKEFEEFLNEPSVKMSLKENRSVIYDVMASHGDTHNLTALTALNQDYDEVINQHVNQNNYLAALTVLKKQNNVELFYKYCPILMEEEPKETIKLLKEQGRQLETIKLLPSLLCLNSDQHRKEIVKYLEYSIHSIGCLDQSIHNYLIQLYAKYNENEKLLTYFETQGKDTTMIPYDIHYALRLCKEYEVKEASVFLLCLLELWQQAVELALVINVELAQQTASQPVDRDERRKLWLIIAEHEIKEKEDVKEALELLKVCDLLRIEDLLPFFSDFQKIDHFKEAIINSLKKYNKKIQEQRRDMDESAKAAENVRNSLQTFRNRSVVINSQDKCTQCGKFLLLKPFFLFPCSHKFHSDCLEKCLMELLPPEDSQRLMKLKQRIAILSTQVEQNKSQNIVSPQTVANRDHFRSELENMLSSECVLCGNLMIQQIDKDFVDDWEKVNKDW